MHSRPYVYLGVVSHSKVRCTVGQSWGETASFFPEVETNLVEDFMDFKQEQTVEAVLNVVKAELGWVFTQDPAYTTTIKNVRDMVRKVRLSEAASQSATQAGVSYRPDNATSVGDVPEDFIKKVIVSKKAKDQDIRNLQVEYHRGFTKQACAHELTASVYPGAFLLYICHIFQCSDF